MAGYDTVIIAWKQLSRRSELLAIALNAKLWFFPDKIPYPRAAFKTLLKVIREKPDNIIVQLPQGPLLVEALMLKMVIGAKVIADVHTGFLLATDWKGLLLNKPFVKLLHAADIITAHNKTQLNLIPKNALEKTIVVLDQWQHSVDTKKHKETDRQEKYLVFPASFAEDEPLTEIIRSINEFNLDTKIYITGNWKRKPEIKKFESEKIIFTGFLSSEKFNSLLSNAAAIITGTKREYTSLMSAWEAVAYMKPLALTTTVTLKDNFEGYAIFYDYKDRHSIADAITVILKSKPNSVMQKELKDKTTESLRILKRKLVVTPA